MAKVVGVLHTSHGPLTYLPPEDWELRRAPRSFRSDVPRENFEECVEKAARARAGLVVLKHKLDAMRPDVLVIFGDDQREIFDFTNFPMLSVFVGEEFSGPEMATRGHPDQYAHVEGHPGLAVHLVRSLMDAGFDPAFSLTDPNPEKGMCHATMNPLTSIAGYDIPTVSVLVNGYFPPQISARRCYAIGRATRDAIDAFPVDLRVVVIGSGGLWHTPGRPESYLDEQFDRTCLSYLENGDILAMAEFFDSYNPSPDDRSQQVPTDLAMTTGMPPSSGPQYGTRETCNWIAAAAVVDRRPNTIVDYIPMYASPIGTAFAYCDDV